MRRLFLLALIVTASPAWAQVYPTNGSDFQYITYPVGPTATPTTLTANASANTKGTYVEFVASTTFTSNRISVCVRQTAAANGRGYLLDVATGAASSEVDVLSNIAYEGFGGSTLRGGGCVTVPLTIASGTRVSARIQSSTGGSTAQVSIMLGRVGTQSAPTSYTTLGANTSTSQGTAVDPGGTINTKGSYVEFTASTSAVTQVMAVIVGANANADPSSAFWYVDIATGGAGAETVIIPDMPYSIGESASVPARNNPSMTVYPYIAASTRIALRTSCSINTAADRIPSFVLLIATGTAAPGGSDGSAGVF